MYWHQGLSSGRQGFKFSIGHYSKPHFIFISISTAHEGVELEPGEHLLAGSHRYKRASNLCND